MRVTCLCFCRKITFVSVRDNLEENNKKLPINTE